jgi:hypothetical protein
MKQILLFSLFTVAIISNAQDLSGTWEGSGRGLGTDYAKMVIIKCEGNRYVGYTYDSGPGFCKANFEGFFDMEKKRLKGENKGMIQKSFDHSQSRYNYGYENRGGVEYLQGPARAKSGVLLVLMFGLGPDVQLKRTSMNVDTTDYMRACLVKYTNAKPDSVITITRIPAEKQVDTGNVINGEVQGSGIPVVINNPTRDIVDLKNERINDTVSTIFTKAPVISISLFDNGQIDGDTVTVFHNGKVIADKLLVSGKPFKFEVIIDEKNPHHEIVFVANNLGSIPPNTAVLIVEAGDKKYNLFASSDLSKNSVVIFQYRPE